MEFEYVLPGDMDVFVDNATTNASCGNGTVLEGADILPSVGPTAGRIATAAFLFLIAALTVVGNGLVLLAVAKHRSLQTLTNAFIMSLCVSDLLVGALVMPPAALTTLFGEWIFPQPFCPIWVSFDVMLCSASILNLCAISLDRFIQITNGLQHGTYMTRTRVAVLITVAWLLSILTSFPPINLGLHEHAGFPTLTNLTFLTVTPQCIFDPNMTYALIGSIVTFYIPLTAILFTYGTIFREAKRQAARVAALNVQLRNEGRNNRGRTGANGITSLKAIRTLGIILGAFMITWLPFFIANVVRPFCYCVSGQVFEVLTWLGWFNSALNPIIYPLFMKDFKRVFKKYMPFCKRDAGDSVHTVPEGAQLGKPAYTRSEFVSEQVPGPATISCRDPPVCPPVAPTMRRASAPPSLHELKSLQEPCFRGPARLSLTLNE
ncbi:D(1) dopamine receptor-like [Branchiostoma floridae]|uniref:D(1) dopamine receptor-like n=1 Tax=Branchiostoma floridae TaxID=7739 RepID=A0A9J7M9R2_BRAFL|nr:D(1) dopamine receptor-like [Branchiostoma floridae]